MRPYKNICCILIATLLIAVYGFKQSSFVANKIEVVSYVVDLEKDDFRLFWKNQDQEQYNSIGKLKSEVESDGMQLEFAMNAGMYMVDRTPLGLYVEKGEVQSKLNTRAGHSGNFYMSPNGVFYTTAEGTAHVVSTEDFQQNDNVEYATQSGPMLLINGQHHPSFNEGSKNLNVRNGVGILADGKVLFAMSKKRVNFYDFASFFKSQGCVNALYLDGFVSRSYIPSINWIQLDGNFGVIAGVVK